MELQAAGVGGISDTKRRRRRAPTLTPTFARVSAPQQFPSRKSVSVLHGTQEPRAEPEIDRDEADRGHEPDLPDTPGEGGDGAEGHEGGGGECLRTTRQNEDAEHHCRAG